MAVRLGLKTIVTRLERARSDADLLIVLVAAMNVVASFTMLVRVKRGSIAILRTMGAVPGTIVRAFFLSAAAVGGGS